MKKYCENIWINPSPHNLRSMQAEPLATHIWLAGSKTTKSFFVLLPTITKIINTSENSPRFDATKFYPNQQLRVKDNQFYTNNFQAKLKGKHSNE